MRNTENAVEGARKALEVVPRSVAVEHGVAPRGFRLPAQTRLGPVRLQVADLERSLAYYGDVLGMSGSGGSAGIARLGDSGGSSLVELVERKGAAPVPGSGRLGLYHFAILLPDRAALGRFVKHLSKRGVRFGASDHLVSEALYLQDPDGLGIEVYADRPRGSWRYAEGQLAMDTRPLDLNDVALAAGDEEWTGMPEGTRVGHIHLHVDDIDQAAAFYHLGLGFDKVVWSYPGALFLSAGGYHHHLGVNTWATGATPAGDTDARLLEWQVLVPDLPTVAAAARSLADQGHSVELAANGDVVARDAWGTVVRLRQV